MSSKIILAKLYFGTYLSLGISWYWGLNVDGRKEVLTMGTEELCKAERAASTEGRSSSPGGWGGWALQARVLCPRHRLQWEDINP